MAEMFSAAELAQAAVEIERRGQAFYKDVAGKAEDPEVKKFFVWFAGEEARHEKLFQELADRLGSWELPAWSTEDEYSDYLKAMLDSHSLFNGGLAELLMAQAHNIQTAIRMAMGFEKDTLLFFTEMKSLVPDSEKTFLQSCIDEEREHLRMLRGKLDETGA